MSCLVPVTAVPTPLIGPFPTSPVVTPTSSTPVTPGALPTIPTPLIEPELTVSPPVIAVTAESDSRSATIIGYTEFSTGGGSPKKYRCRTMGGSMVLDKSFASTTCAALYPGFGGQSGVFPVFFFANEYSTGTVSCALTDVTAGVCTYVLSGATYSPHLPSPPGYLQGPTLDNWYYTVSGYPNNTPAIGGTFTQPAGSVFSISLSVAGVAWGGDSYPYEAGREQITDTWNQSTCFNAITGVESVVTRTMTRVEYGTTTSLADTTASGALATWNPSLLYVPKSTLIVALEPVHVIVDNVSATLKRTVGLGCVLGTGFGLASLNALGTISDTLSDEDTEADALIRAVSTLGTSLMARFQDRASGFAFEHTSVNLSLSLSALIIGANYSISIPLVTENYGGGSPVASAITIAHTAGATTASLTQLITAAVGKQSTVGTVTITEI